MARSPQISNHRKPVLLTSLAYRIIHLATCFWIVSCKVNQHRNSELERYTAKEVQVMTQVQNWFYNWLLVSQSNLEGTGSSSGNSLEQATTAKASMMLSPDLQVLSRCQDRASHLRSSTGGRLPLKNGTKARNTTCRHTHPFFERWSHYATHTDLSLNPCLTTRLVLQVFATTSGL